MEQKFNKINSQGEIYPQMILKCNLVPRSPAAKGNACSKILIIKGNFWTNRPVHGLLACYKRSYRIFFFTIFSSRNGPSRRLNNNRKTSALIPEAKTLTEEPTRICRIFSFRLQKCQSLFLICTGSSGAYVLNSVNRTVAGLYITDEEAFT